MRRRNRLSVTSYGADFQIAHPSFMASSIWAAVLTLAVILGSLALSCVAPLCALAVALSATLGLRASFGVMTLVWLVNQAVGYTLFHFPRTANSFGWGLAIGIGALMITIVTRAVMRRTSRRSAWFRLGSTLLATLAVYEVVLWAASFILGGRDMFTVPIVLQVAGINAAWLLAIVILNEVVAAFCKPWLGRMPMVGRSPGFVES
jgi:hypothetical protein